MTKMAEMKRRKQQKSCTKSNYGVEERKKIKLFPAGLEPATFRVLGGRDNHYTTETFAVFQNVFYIYKH